MGSYKTEVPPHLHEMTDVIGLVGDPLIIYRPFSFFFTTTPLDSEILGMFSMAQTVVIPANFNGSTARIGTNPTGAFVLSIMRNDEPTPIGTISVASDGTIVWLTLDGVDIVYEAEDWMTIVAPNPPDATIANVAVTIKGQIG